MWYQIIIYALDSSYIVLNVYNLYLTDIIHFFSRRELGFDFRVPIPLSLISNFIQWSFARLPEQACQLDELKSLYKPSEATSSY